MSEKTAVRTREKWCNDVKVIACILVVLGHFFQSMTKANILPENDLYEWFETTIYYLHVPLFFICSGYLYQKYSKVNSVGNRCRNVVKKTLAFGVPYLTFSIATWLLKTVFADNVNKQADGLFSTLVVNPSAPYWYLYALFFIFLVTPTFSGVKAATVGLIVALVAKVLILTEVQRLRSIEILSNEIWFVLGMSMCGFNVQLNGRKVQGTIYGLLFIVLSIAVYTAEISVSGIFFAMGLLACVAVILMVEGFEEKFGRGMDFLVKYTMPIFLMHTLFAAPMRSVLLKMGITNAAVHIVLGLGISFTGLIIAAWIMKKTRLLEFFLYPNKILQRK